MAGVFDGPVGTDGPCEALWVEVCGGDVVSLGAGGLALLFDLSLDHGDGREVWEAGLAGIVALAPQPVEILGQAVGSGLEAAMVLVEKGQGLEFGLGRGLEIASDLPIECCLIALDGQEVVAASIEERWSGT